MELNKRFTIKLNVNEISDEGIRLIREYIHSQNLPDLPFDWAWLWLVDRGTYRGTFPKRAAKYYATTHKIKLADEQLSELGNLARNHAHDGEYTFEFVDEFDWNAGDFGDDHSCYFGDERAFTILRENGAMAIRFYHAGEGYGRAWVATIRPDELYIVFNGYGLQTRRIARILAEFLGFTYRQISLTNNGTASGTLWINDSTGYAVGRDITITRHDLGWYDDYHSCESCGRALGIDECYSGPDDRCYCERCYYDTFDTCELCDHTHFIEDMDWIDDTRICRWCRDDRYALCDDCEEWYPKEEITEVDGDQLCEECRKDRQEQEDNEPDQ